MSGLSRLIGRLRKASRRWALADRPINDCHDLLKWFREAHENRVLSGPFQGLRYGDLSFGSTHLPKLLGTYERELAGFFSRAVLRQYETFINLGCAEGYYTNGIAHALKERTDGKLARVTGFDVNEKALDESRRISALNGLHVTVTQQFDFRSESWGEGKTLVICDVEGAEIDLVQPSRIPNLNRTDLMIEIHDTDGRTAILDELQQRFAVTHASCVILFKPRVGTDFPTDVFPPMDDRVKLEAMDERRKRGMRWLHLKSNST